MTLQNYVKRLRQALGPAGYERIVTRPAGYLIEQGMDARFVQEQVGHEHASTTAIYTCVSSDFRTRTLRRALDATMQAALRPARRAR